MKSYIYIITDGEHYKIGKTNNIKQRLKSLSTGSPKTLSIVDMFNVDKEYIGYVESKLHDKFKKYNINGEWFSSEIRDYIPDVKTTIENIVKDIGDKDVHNKDEKYEPSASNIIRNIKSKLSSELTKEKIRVFITNTILNGASKKESKRIVLDAFSAIYTNAFNDIIENIFEEMYQEAAEKAKIIHEININNMSGTKYER